jgi:HlyD family secretion protein
MMMRKFGAAWPECLHTLRRMPHTARMLAAAIGRRIRYEIAEALRPRDDGPHPSDGVRRALIVGLLVVGVLVFGGGLWAGTVSLAGAVLATGTVVVDSNVKKVQHASGGTVGAILVEDGDRVEQGALLIRLDETMVRASLQIVTKQLDEIAVRKMRLTAERDGADALAIPPELEPRQSELEIAALLTAERNLFASRHDARLGQTAQLRQRIAQLRQEADGLAAQQWAKGREIDLVGKELDGAEKLYGRNLMPITKLTALQREAARLAGERGQLISQQAQTTGRVAEIELQIIQIDQDLRAEVMKELREVTAKEAELVERRVAAEDQLRHIEIRAPQTGLVHQLTVHTVGGVIAQGETLMLIVPEHDALVVEAKIAPQDIDHVRAGQPAFIRFTAFDQRTTPEFDAQVTRVAADLTKDQQTGAAYFVARLSLTRRAGEADGDVMDAHGVAGRQPEGGAGKGFALVPGMPAEVHIRTSERTALSYFLKPLTDQVARAFTER